MPQQVPAVLLRSQLCIQSYAQTRLRGRIQTSYSRPQRYSFLTAIFNRGFLHCLALHIKEGCCIWVSVTDISRNHKTPEVRQINAGAADSRCRCLSDYDDTLLCCTLLPGGSGEDEAMSPVIGRPLSDLELM